VSSVSNHWTRVRLGHQGYDQTLALLLSWMGQPVEVRAWTNRDPNAEVTHGRLLRAGVLFDSEGAAWECIGFYVGRRRRPAFVIDRLAFDVGHHFTWEGRPALGVLQGLDTLLVLR
jgi:hypothetical protein